MKEFQVRLEQIGGCGDGGCMIHVRPGMHTNGGCRCSTNPFKMRQTVHAYKGAVAAQAQENERLRALVIRAYAEGFGDGWGEYDEQLSEGVERDWCWERSDTRAALQPKEGEG